MRLSFLLTFVVLCVLHNRVNSYKILCVFPTPSKSHYYVGHALLKGLAKEGHEVTMISPFREKKPIDNYSEVFLEKSWELSRKHVAKDNFMDYNDIYFWDLIPKMYEIGANMTEWALASENLQKFLKTKAHFDVVIVEMVMCDAFLGLGHHFNAPVIGMSAFGASQWTTDLVGSPNFASYVPHTYHGYSDRMDFWQRMYNSLSFWFEDIIMSMYDTPKQQEALEQLFPNSKNMPSIKELRRNVSLVLLNTHVTLGTPRPYAPNMIEVGGIQINQEIEPLPKNIQTFLDEAKNGAIYLSLGSNVLFSKLETHIKEAIISAFSQFPEVRVLLKSEEDVKIPSHKATDVLYDSWLPQASILAHPKVRVFITHGGLLGTTESVHFGKPVIGIPFFFDQHLNMMLAEQKGYGINIPIESLTEEKIRYAVRELIENSRYTEQARIISDRYHDQLKTPLETAIHWVKHVAKNKGAPHLHSVAVDLPFYTLYNLDVWAFISVISLAAAIVLKAILQQIYSVISQQIKGKVKTQ